MGRVKIAPTPRNTALNDAMRRAAVNITSSSGTKPMEIPKSLPLPPVSRPLVKAAKSSLPSSRVSKEPTKDRSSVESQKRKSDPSDELAPPTKKPAITKLTLRSATKSSPISNGEVTEEVSEGSPMQTATLVEPPRRSTRASKTTSTMEDISVKKSLRGQAKSPRPVRTRKKNTKPLSPTIAEEEERQAAIAMLQGENILHSDSPAALDQSPSHMRLTRAKTSRRGSAVTLSTQPEEANSERRYDVLPPPSMSSAHTPVPTDSVNTFVPTEQVAILLSESEEFKLDHPVGLPTSRQASPGEEFQAHHAPILYTYPDPNNASTTIPAAVVVNRANVSPNQNGVHRSSATSGDSGYVTAQAPPQPVYMNGFGPVNGDLAFPVVPETPDATEAGPYHFVVSTKGQKVKGRPNPRYPKPRESTPRTGRNVANTYPRKQPFKAQIEFPSYPPAGSDVPPDFTLWEICQNMPNSLREQVLLGFVQREWSANELCACLKEDAREILNARPGKDKTMVFQKRMERIKKDLVAKGEYENLLRGPMIREDGRPTWVKRGNVRRK